MIFATFLYLFLFLKSNIYVIKNTVLQMPPQGFFENVVQTNLQKNDFGFLEQLKSSRRPRKINERSLGIFTTARAAIVIDEDSGTVLFEKNSKEKLPIASLTKLMTALVFLETNPDWEKEIKLLKEEEKEGSILYARAGEKVKVKDLFNMMLVGSVNNAALALVRSTGLSQEDFVKKMNEKAKDLEMHDTFFVDPTGLEPANTSTVSDLARLVVQAFQREEIQKATTLSEYVFKTANGKTYYIKNTNELLLSFLNKPPYKIIGGKTGYLDEAKYCLALETERDGHRIISVVLGSDTLYDRFQESKGLIVWAFENFVW
jgi:D-alanyl-D-alanine carboxypeptidase